MPRVKFGEIVLAPKYHGLLYRCVMGISLVNVHRLLKKCYWEKKKYTMGEGDSKSKIEITLK